MTASWTTLISPIKEELPLKGWEKSWIIILQLYSNLREHTQQRENLRGKVWAKKAPKNSPFNKFLDDLQWSQMHFQPGFLPPQGQRTTQICTKLRMSLPIWNPLVISRRKQTRTAAGAAWTARAQHDCSQKKESKNFPCSFWSTQECLGTGSAPWITQGRFCLCHPVWTLFFRASTDFWNELG